MVFTRDFTDSETGLIKSERGTLLGARDSPAYHVFLRGVSIRPKHDRILPITKGNVLCRLVHQGRHVVFKRDSLGLRWGQLHVSRAVSKDSPNEGQRITVPSSIADSTREPLVTRRVSD